MSRFLLLTARPERDAAAAEFASVARAMGVRTDALDTHALDQAPLVLDDLERYSGIVVGGSPFNVTTAAAHKSAAQQRTEHDLRRLADWAIAGDRPVLFTCYGIGVLTEFLGGTVSTRFGEAAAGVTIELSEAGLVDDLTAILPHRFTGLVGHKEATEQLPAGVSVLARSASCPVQIYRVDDSRVWATQFHPEVTPSEFAERARIYRDHGYFAAAEYDRVSAELRALEPTVADSLLRQFATLCGRDEGLRH